MTLELSPKELKKHFAPEELNIISTENLQKLTGIIGQQRAVNALKFGLQIDGCGYNVYVSGPPGTGKMTSVQSFIEELAKEKETPSDWCYVNNFDDPYNPKSIELPPGKGAELKEDMNGLIERIQNELPKAFDSDDYNNQKEEILSDLKNRQEAISREMNEKAAKRGFKLQPTPMGIVFVPVKDDQPLTESQMQSLSDSEKEEMNRHREELQEEMKSVMKKIRQLERETQEKVKDLDKQIALHTVGGVIDDLIEKYEDYEKVVNHLKEVQKDIVENVSTFKAQEGQGQQMQPAAQGAQLQMLREMTTKNYKVNLLVDNSKRKGAPVIVEFNPTHNNLLGRIEKEMQMGALNTDFTMIRPGSLQQANGGFLVMPIEDLLKNIYSYDGLKRALRSTEVQIEELGERLGFMATKSLRPQPIPVNVKVVLVGPPFIYHLLQTYDPDFSELFKVKADYDTQMSINDKNVQDFLSFVSTYCEKEELMHLDNQATTKILEHALRMAEDQEKLSTKFGLIADIIRESNFWATQDDNKIVEKKHVQKALNEKIYRSNLIQVRIEEMIERGTILIDTDKAKIGQVNGLSVIDLGDYQFGKPNRITATVGPGRGGIVDIEREVKLGGPIHSKGVLILSGYLLKKYSLGKPLTLAARLVFEQSYQGIDGDSASAAELFAIISALSEVPLKQGIAVTGSVNQQGEIQSIGGINQKIEGFYDVCKATGLNGDQGAVIPKSNVKNLLLRDDVIDSVESGQFHIWAVESIDQGLEILTGSKAGKLQSDGTFPKDSVNEKVRQRLDQFEKAFPKSAEST